MQKHLLDPHRLRRIPPQFSWVDHRLVRHNHLARASATAWGLYLVLITVGDEHGLSYYSEGSLGRMLSLSPEESLMPSNPRSSDCRTPAIRRGRRQLEPVSALAGF